MTNQEVRRMSKVQVLTLLCQQEEEIKKLNALNQDLKQKIKALTLHIEQSGSLTQTAQSAIQSLQNTAILSYKNVKAVEKEKLKAAEKIVHDAKDRAREIQDDANRYNAMVVSLLEEKAKKMATIFEWQRNQLNTSFIEFNNMMKHLGIVALQNEEDTACINDSASNNRHYSEDENCFYADEVLETIEYDCLEHEEFYSKRVM